MKLSLTVTENSAVMTREKWGVIAFALIADCVCIGIGIAFCTLALQKQWAPALFPLFFGAVFGLLGLGHLLFMFPKQTRQIIKDGGLRVLVADKDTLTLTKVYGAPSHTYKWDDIDEIVLAGELKIADVDETSYMWNTMLVFFKPDVFTGKNLIERAKTGISTSGRGRGFNITNYPSQQQDELANALQKFLHRPTMVKCYKKAIFNLKGDSTVDEKLS